MQSLRSPLSSFHNACFCLFVPKGVTINIDPEMEDQIRSMLEQLPHYLGNSVDDQMPGSSRSNTSVHTKYNHLPDSQFKKNFLRSLTESIDCKIERLLKTHSVCLKSCKLN